MPVPVSVTNPTGKGLIAHACESVESLGPFERMARAAAAAKQQQQQDLSERQPDGELPKVAAVAPSQPQNFSKQPALAANNLSFSYPGLGKLCALEMEGAHLAGEGGGGLACRPGCSMSQLVTQYLSGHFFYTPQSETHIPLHELAHAQLNTRRNARPTIVEGPPTTHALTTTIVPPADGRPVPGVPPLISGMSFALPAGSRCLLLGANGAGKTTLLKILGGKHMVPQAAVAVLGRPPFHDTQLTASGDLAYVGGNWTRDIAFAGTSVPLTVCGREWGA
jgi:ABC-type multidrug transport system fused ATPase/permease subunit